MPFIGQLVGTVIGFLLDGWHGALLGNFIGFCALTLLVIFPGILCAMVQDPEIGNGRGWRKEH
jgi:phosphotransferase system  glucose/maltose/N-acetylglucosamine-specific IIC component